MNFVFKMMNFVVLTAIPFTFVATSAVPYYYKMVILLA